MHTMIKRGVNNSFIRIENRKRLTRLLYDNENMTRQDLAYTLNLSAPTIKLLLDMLEGDGLITYSSTEESSGGRIPDYVIFNYNAFYSIGVEITKSYYRVIIVNLRLKILIQDQFNRVFDKADAYWRRVSASIHELILQAGLSTDKVIGVGISIPGPVDQKNCVVEFAPTLKLKDFSFAHLDEIFDFPIWFENDAKAAGFAEAWRKDDLGNIVYLSLSKGVGGAIVNKHKMEYGINNHSGEFGHMTLVPQGAPCECGKNGCLEVYCSTDVLKRAADGDLNQFFKLKKTDERLQEIYQTYLNNLAISISNIIMAIDLPVIVGGELSYYLEGDFPLLREKINNMIPFDTNTAMCLLSNYKDTASMIGCALRIIVKRIKILE